VQGAHSIISDWGCCIAVLFNFSLAEEKMQAYQRSIKEEEAYRSSPEWTNSGHRLKFCSHVRFGQLKLLQSLLQSCQS
jgi:hypothetical protein